MLFMDNIISFNIHLQTKHEQVQLGTLSINYNSSNCLQKATLAEYIPTSVGEDPSTDFALIAKILVDTNEYHYLYQSFNQDDNPHLEYYFVQIPYQLEDETIIIGDLIEYELKENTDDMLQKFFNMSKERRVR